MGNLTAFNLTAKQQHLVDTTYLLLADSSVADLTYQQVASAAEMQLSNCYRHFESLVELLRHLAAQRVQLAIDANEYIAPETAISLNELIQLRSHQLRDHFNRHPIDSELVLSRAYMGIILGGHRGKFCASQFLGDYLYDGFNQRFVLPEQAREVLRRMVYVSLPLWSYYYNQDGQITDLALDDIVQHQVSYLSYFFSANLPIRANLHALHGVDAKQRQPEL